MQVAPGTTVDRYTIETLLGTGGMAAVYLALHNQLGSRHAIKVLTLPTPAVQARLLQEGRAQSQVRHPNIVPVTDVIEVGGSPGLVMEYVHGPTLRQLLKVEILDLEQVDRLARGILRGVAAAHRAGLVHRDLKPGNILLAPTDDTLVPKITDFGLAKVLSPGAGGGLRTRSGLPMGTPSYMAPEQIRDAANVDARADVWALGCILYEMLTARRAFDGADVVETYANVAAGEYVDPRTLVPTLPERMARAVDGALRKDPDQRFSEVSALLETWRGGVDVSEAGTLDPGLLDRVRSLVAVSDPSRTPLSGGSATSWGSGGSEETWADPGIGLDPAPAPSLIGQGSTTPAPGEGAGSPSASGPPWRGLLVGGLALVVLGAGAWVLLGGEPEPVGFTVDTVPELVADPVVQGELEQAWRALLDVDLEQAERRLSVVVESGVEDPAAWLLHSRALTYADRHGEAVDALWRARELAGERTDPGAELARLAARARQESWDQAGADLLAWLDAHPDDLLGHLVVLGTVPAEAPEVADALVARTRALDPDVALIWWIEARLLVDRSDFEGAEEALRAGLDANPRTPALLAGLGDVLLRRGRVDAARDALVEALDVDPGNALARTRLAAAWLLLGQDEDVERTTDQMMSAPTRWTDQARYARYLAQAYVGVGRLDEAVALLDRAAKEAARRSEWTTALIVSSSIPVIYLDADMVLPMIDSTEALRELSHQPEIPDKERETLVRNLLYAEGIGHVRTGKLAEAEAVLERLRGLDRVWPVYLEWLERELAVARGKADRVAALHRTTPPGCQGDLEKAHSLWRAGGHPDLVPLLDARLAETGHCSQVGTERFLQAVAHVTRADLAWSAGDRDLAERHLAAFDALWPSPDRGVPAAERARSLRIRMGSR